jgi:hypothetical protein
MRLRGHVSTVLCGLERHMWPLASEHSPFAFTHSAFRLGRAAWSLSCSRDSGGSL